MGRGLEQGVGCLSNLDPGQNALSWCIQGTSPSHTHHLTTRLRRVHRVVYVALLGELCSWIKHQTMQSHWPSVTLFYCQTTRSSDDVHYIPSAHCECHRDVDCALDMFNTTRSFTHMSNTCVIRRLVFLNLGFIDLLSCTASCHPSQPRIKEFWSTNLKILRLL